MVLAPGVALTSRGGKKGLTVSIPNSKSQTDRRTHVPSLSLYFLAMNVQDDAPVYLPAQPGTVTLRTGTMSGLSLVPCSAQSLAGIWQLEVFAKGKGGLLGCTG